MKRLNIEQRSDEWIEFRKGKVSGTVLADLYSPRGGHKLGFYELVAARLDPDRDDEDRMDRGLRLEEEAIKLFEQKTNKKVERGGVCVSDIDSRIINSPDGLIKKGKKYTEAVEVKCLGPAYHWMAVIENDLPKNYYAQAAQYFIVNSDLEKLHVVFYDPDNLYVPYHKLTLDRKYFGDKLAVFLDFQLSQLQEIDEIVERYSF